MALLEETVFEGKISYNDVTAHISFGITITDECRIIFDIKPVASKVFLLISKSQGKAGTLIEDLSLHGESKGGEQFSSQSVYLVSYKTSDAGFHIFLAAREVKIIFLAAQPIEKPVLRRWFRSFKTFRNSIVETSLGKLIVEGDNQKGSHDDMSGAVALESNLKIEETEWLENGNNFLRHMHNGLAFAHGGRLQCPRVDYIHNTFVETTIYQGEGFKPELAVQHYLNHDPFIKALVQRYENYGPLSEIYWTALGWMQTHSTFDKVRFLTAMTAIEAIVNNELPKRYSRLIEKPIFKSIHRKINNLLKNDKSLSEEQLLTLSNGISQLNRRSLRSKINALFEYYDIPKNDFDDVTIRKLVSLRNDIVHRGIISGEENIWSSIVLVRDLFTRIVLREIGFEGKYCCYIDGQHDRDFPGKSERQNVSQTNSCTVNKVIETAKSNIMMTILCSVVGVAALAFWLM